MNVFIVLSFLIENIIFVFSIQTFMGIFFFKRNASLSNVVFSYLLYFVTAGVWRFLLLTGVMTEPLTINASHVLITTVTLIIISLSYESSMIKRLIVVAFNYVLFTVFINFAISAFMILPISPFENEMNTVSLLYLIGSILSYLAVLLLSRFKSIRKNNIILPKFWSLVVFVQVLVIATAIFVPYDSPIYISFNLPVLFILLVANLLILYLYDSMASAYEDKLNSELHSQEKEYYFTQCKLMQESVENIKTIRHDMKFHLVTATDFMASNKVDEAMGYLKGLLGSIEKSEIYSNTKNIAFDSIINFKLKNAAEDNIKLDIRLLIPPTLNIEVADIVTILGNLLDNALDAIAKVEDKAIKLNVEYSKESLFIQVENTFDGIVKYAKGTDMVILTQKSGGEHGYGLKNIRKSVEKYNGHVDISHEGNVFSVGILLYVGNMEAF